MMTDNDQAVDNPTAITLPDPATLPPGARVLANGTVTVNGRFVTGPTHPPINHATASMYAHRRHEAARRAFAQGVTEAAIETGKLPRARAGSAAAWGAVAKHAGTVFFDASTPRALSDLGRFLGVGMDALPDRVAAAASDNGDSVTATITAPADVVLAVLAELQRRRSGDLG